MGCAAWTRSPAQPGAPSASGTPRAVAGSSMRSHSPLGRGEAPHTHLAPEIMAWRAVSLGEQWESRVFPSPPLSLQGPFLPGGEAELLQRAALPRGRQGGHLHVSLCPQRPLCLPGAHRHAPAAHPQQRQVPRPAVAHGEQRAGLRGG